MSVKNTWQDAENLDDTHSYNTYIWIPEETFQVKLMKIRLYAEKFRAHSKSALDGGAAVVTSEEKTPNHTHQVAIGTPTSESGGGRHRHDVEIGTKTSGATSNYVSGYLIQDSDVRYAHYDSDPESALVSFNASVGQVLVDVTPQSHTHNVAIGTITSEYKTPDHTHDVEIGTKTSAEGGGAHTHSVTLADHDHDIEYGIYEEAITGRTLSAKLYDPNDVLIKDFGVLLTGEDNDEIDLSDYFDELVYGMYKLVLEASGRLRARVVFYELSIMYAFT